VAKDTRIPIRVPSALKAEFEWAAEQDGCTKGVSTWLRQLGEQRAEELRVHAAGGTIEDAIAAQRRRNGATAVVVEHATRAAEPVLEFIPGLGLEEE
jgi:hypothetical protein